MQLSSDSKFQLMKISLQAAVPLYIMEIKERGGPSTEDIKRAQQVGDDLAGPGGEDILFPSKKAGRTAEMFNGLAHAIAVLSFVPGGIEIFGTHFEATPPLRKIARG